MYTIIGADRKEYGPVSAEQVRQWIAEGRANGATLARAEGQQEWRPLSSFAELNITPHGAPPPFAAPTPVQSTVANASGRLQGPGVALLVVGILVILGSVGDLTFNMFGHAAPQIPGGNAELNEMIQKLLSSAHGPLAAFWGALHVALGVLITVAGIRLRQARSYGLVMTGAILAMIPCTAGTCCCVGLPIGIWVLMTIMDPAVKALFT